MKKTLSSILLMGAVSSLSLFSCSNGNTFKIDGTCSEEIPDSVYYVFVSDENLEFANPMVPVDTIVVNDAKKTFSWECDKYNEVRLINLQAVFKGTQQLGAYVDFVLCPGETAKLKVCNGFFHLEGSKFYHDWNVLDDSLMVIRELAKPLQISLIEFESRIMATLDPATGQPTDTALLDKFNALRQQMDNLGNTYSSLPYNYMRENPDAEGDVAFLCLGGFHIKDSINVKSQKVLNGRMKKMIDKSIEKMANREKERAEREAKSAEAQAATAEGKMFTDFECEYEGKIQKLSDYVGKGKYVLVDFWASWCGPCRGEIPNLIEVYNKYKGPKFDVIGVAAWDEPEDTKQAIEEDKIPYAQIMNSQKAGTDVYGIMGIPHIILFGPDGTIMSRNLRGPQIEEAVKAALGK